MKKPVTTRQANAPADCSTQPLVGPHHLTELVTPFCVVWPAVCVLRVPVAIALLAATPIRQNLFALFVSVGSTAASHRVRAHRANVGVSRRVRDRPIAKDADEAHRNHAKRMIPMTIAPMKPPILTTISPSVASSQ